MTKNTNKKKRVRKQMERSQTNYLSAARVLQQKNTVERIPTPWGSLNKMLGGGYLTGFHTLTLTAEQRGTFLESYQDSKEVRVLFVTDEEYEQVYFTSSAIRGADTSPWKMRQRNTKHVVLDEWYASLVKDLEEYKPEMLVLGRFKQLYEHHGRSSGTMMQAYADKLNYVAKQFNIPVIALRVDESEQLTVDTIRYGRLVSAVTAMIDETNPAALFEFSLDVPRKQDSSFRITLPWEDVTQLYCKDGTVGLNPGLHVWTSSYHFALEDIAAIAAYDGNESSLRFTSIGSFNTKTYQNEIFMKREIPILKTEDHTIRGAYNPDMLQRFNKKQLLEFIREEKTRKYPTQLLVLNQALTSVLMNETNSGLTWNDNTDEEQKATRAARRVWMEDFLQHLHETAIEQSFPILLLEEVAGVDESSIQSVAEESVSAFQKKLDITDNALEQVATFTYVSPQATPEKAVRFTQVANKRTGHSALVPWDELY